MARIETEVKKFLLLQISNLALVFIQPHIQMVSGAILPFFKFILFIVSYNLNEYIVNVVIYINSLLVHHETMQGNSRTLQSSMPLHIQYHEIVCY
jgi:hypothetical protein